MYLFLHAPHCNRPNSPFAFNILGCMRTGRTSYLWNAFCSPSKLLKHSPPNYHTGFFIHSPPCDRRDSCTVPVCATRAKPNRLSLTDRVHLWRTLQLPFTDCFAKVPPASTSPAVHYPSGRATDCNRSTTYASALIASSRRLCLVFSCKAKLNSPVNFSWTGPHVAFICFLSSYHPLCRQPDASQNHKDLPFVGPHLIHFSRYKYLSNLFKFPCALIYHLPTGF